MSIAGSCQPIHNASLRTARIDFVGVFERLSSCVAGYDADLTIVDLKRSETITNKWIASKAGWTPYDGVRATGWPVGTFVRGQRVMWQGELLTPATGEPVRFMETLWA